MENKDFAAMAEKIIEKGQEISREEGSSRRMKNYLCDLLRAVDKEAYERGWHDEHERISTVFEFDFMWREAEQRGLEKAARYLRESCHCPEQGITDCDHGESPAQRIENLIANEIRRLK